MFKVHRQGQETADEGKESWIGGQEAWALHINCPLAGIVSLNLRVFIFLSLSVFSQELEPATQDKGRNWRSFQEEDRFCSVRFLCVLWLLQGVLINPWGFEKGDVGWALPWDCGDTQLEAGDFVQILPDAAQAQ